MMLSLSFDGAGCKGDGGGDRTGGRAVEAVTGGLQVVGDGLGEAVS